MKKIFSFFALLGSSLFANSWNVDSDGNWDVNTNWDTNTVPDGVGADAGFKTVITAPRIVTILTQKTVSELTFNSGIKYTIAGSSLILDDTGTPDVKVDLGSHLFSAPLILNKTTDFAVQPSQQLEVSGAISGVGGINLGDGGTLLLTGSNTFTGAVLVDEGIFSIGGVGDVLPAEKSVNVQNLGTFQVEQSMNPTSSVNVVLNGLGQLVQANGSTVKLSSISGAGQLKLDAVTGGAVTVLGASTFNGVVSGGVSSVSLDPDSGSRLETSGSGTKLTLTNANTYVSRTFAKENTQIRIENADALGTDSLAVALDTGAFEVNTAGATIAKEFALNGKGEFAQGALRNLSGTNTISGDVSIGWSFGGISATDVAIGADGLDIFSISGVVQGSQELQKVGTGTLRLSGASANTHTGLTRVSEGELNLDKTGAVAISGDVLIETSGLLKTSQIDQFGASTKGTLEGGTFDLDGNAQTLDKFAFNSGTLTQGGAALTVSSSNDALTLRDVIISGEVKMTGAAGAAVQFDATNGGTGEIQTLGMGASKRVVDVKKGNAVDDLLIGTSTGVGFEKIGEGRLVLIGVQNHTASQVDLSAGTTIVDGNLIANPVNVLSGATLGGNGTVTSDVVVKGIVSPGTSIGTLTAVGDFSFDAGSTYLLEFNPTMSDLLSIQNGNLSISSGATLQIVPDFGMYQGEFTYSIIQAFDGMRTGEFGTVTISLPLFSPQVIYLSNEVQLRIQILDFSEVVSNGNAHKVAVCLDELRPTATGDLAFVISELQFIPTDDGLIKAVNQLHPSPLKGLALTQEDNALHVRSAISNRLYATDRRACCCVDECCRDCSWSVWLDVGGSWYDQKKSGGELGFDSESITAVLGIDFQNACDWVFGISGAYSYSDVDWDKSRADGKIHNGYGSFYTGFSCDCFYGNLVLLGAYNHYDEKRKIKFEDINRRAKADFNGGQFLGHLDVGGIWACGGIEVRPYVGVDYIYLHQDGFTEHGAKSLNLRVKCSDYDLVRGEVGGIFSFCMPLDCLKLTFDSRFAYVREERFRGRTYTAGFKGTDCTFKVKGLRPDRNIFAPSAGFLGSGWCDDCFKVGIYWDGEFAKHYRNNRVDIFLLYTF